MNNKYLPFHESANVLIRDSAMHVRAVTAAVALAASSLAHLPSTEVDNPTSYFNMQIIPTITAVLSEWNENMILDIRATIDQVRMFWLVRYTAAYPLSRPMYSANYDFFDTVIGVSAFISKDFMAFLDGENKQAILSLTESAVNLMRN